VRRWTRATRLTTLAVGSVLAVGALGCGRTSLRDGASPTGSTTSAVTPTSVASPAPESSTTSTVPVAGTAAAVLATLPVKGRAPKTGYARARFGPAWADVDHDGCDTRNDVLRRDLTAVTYRPGTHDCVVVAGQLVDPYTGRTITFEKARATAVQIDHVVALGDAWQTGAQQLTADQREHLANDPINLLAVDGPTNQSKSDSDAASWLPPSRAFRCAYVARQVAVKAAYALWVTPAEHDAIAAVLATCPDEPPAAVRGEPVAPAAAPPSAPTASIAGSLSRTSLGSPGCADADDRACWTRPA
jgi:hypothetical protein